MHKVGFIGAGLQARRRIPAIQSANNSQVVCITSLSGEKAAVLAKQYNLKTAKNWQEIVKDPEIDIVVVATFPDSHSEITIEALKAGKHVLCEKPLAKTIDEAKSMVLAAKKYKRILKCGFNHRHHPAILEAKNLIDSGKIGSLLFGRGIYGHLGRPGFEKEWRVNKKYSSGGILMEQGIHLVDLYSWFFGNAIKKVHCFKETLYFPIKPYEDTAFVTLQTNENQMISINSTNLQWRNMFSFEIYGTEGYIKVEGLGQSYGVEKLILGQKDYVGPFTETIKEFRGEDTSWKKEWEEFIASIDKKKQPLGNGEDGLRAMEIVNAAYDSAKKKGITITL